ncbi:hypothetical protein EAO71_36785 [Streptomyces sp. ms191]|uniref:hypothetical protein n=1 Tax=Streptomyces sp. ms191 TaxID=1827978 RepID=UPI0011CE91D1|nr:hypothetical protein [Streptomyces sp. ms191]TXS09955.1 hypothetical protein EAO71_36785 [Streptomyces sp. ms191]
MTSSTPAPDASTGTATPAARLSRTVLDALLAGTGLRERPTPWTVLTSPASPDPVGSVRYFRHEGRDGGVDAAVAVSLVVPALGLDSHMVFAFGDGDGPLPHFTLDSVQAGGGYAFHLDLVQRVDLAVSPAYADLVYGPLSAPFARASEIPGLAPAAISPRQRSLMSPWMLVHRADEPALQAITPIAAEYLRHWLGLARAFPADAAGEAKEGDAPVRDRRLRQALFSREIDPVWAQVDRLLGQATTDGLRGLLTTGRLSGEEAGA